MAKQKDEKGLTVKKEEDMPEWYSQVCLKSELVDYGAVKGTMIIRPNGYSIWEAIQDYFNKNILKTTGVRNASFPLFIPESFFKKEASHAEGFSPEVAWVDPKITGDGERIAIRPTSETIIYDSYSKWIRSYKDLPLKINQWCNVVRWETKATKLFLRSREFLWQEGHCAYETEKECAKEAINYIKLYEKLCKDLLALPVLTGPKTEKETFPGAVTTYTIEAFMPDGKALQCGTSHNLGQGFAEAFDIKFLGKDEKEHRPWQNTWGLSTRLIGGLVMTHSDDKGLVLPPNIAENKLVMIPIIIGKDKKVMKKALELKDLLQPLNPIFDDRSDYSAGWKYSEWELKGIPLRLEIGPRDLEKNEVILVRRDTGSKEAVKINSKLLENINKLLDTIQKSLYKKAKKNLDDKIITVETWKDFLSNIEKKNIVKTKFCGESSCEEKIKEESGASSRLIESDTKGKCIKCNKTANHMIYFSKSY